MVSNTRLIEGTAKRMLPHDGQQNQLYQGASQPQPASAAAGPHNGAKKPHAPKAVDANLLSSI